MIEYYPPTEIHYQIEEKQPYQKMLQDIANYSNCKPLAHLWEALWGNFKDIENVVEKWDCKPNGHFQIKLKEPLKVWLNADDPIGGSIFFFNTKVVGKITEKNLHLHNGFYCYCMHWFPIKGYTGITPSMIHIGYESNGSIKIGGRMLGFTHYHRNSLDRLKKGWKSGIQVKGNHQRYLQKKHYDILRKTSGK